MNARRFGMRASFGSARGGDERQRWWWKTRGAGSRPVARWLCSVGALLLAALGGPAGSGAVDGPGWSGAALEDGAPRLAPARLIGRAVSGGPLVHARLEIYEVGRGWAPGAEIAAVTLAGARDYRFEVEIPVPVSGETLLLAVVAQRPGAPEPEVWWRLVNHVRAGEHRAGITIDGETTAAYRALTSVSRAGESDRPAPAPAPRRSALPDSPASWRG